MLYNKNHNVYCGYIFKDGAECIDEYNSATHGKDGSHEFQFSTMPDYVECVVDNGGRTADRYTIIFEDGTGYFSSPQGVGMYTDGLSGIPDNLEEDETTPDWAELPYGVRKLATIGYCLCTDEFCGAI